MVNGNEKLNAVQVRGRRALCGLAVTAMLALYPPIVATDAIAAPGTLIPLSPDFDYSHLCIAPPAVPAPKNWSNWDGKSASTVSPDDMLRDAQTLFNPYSRFSRSPATAERIARYLTEVPFAGSGRA